MPPLSNTAILKSHHTIVITPFNNDQYGFQDTLYRSFQTDTDYDVRKDDPNKKKVPLNEMRIQGTFSRPKVKSKKYFKEQTVCHKQDCWHQKVLCLERNISIEASLFIYNNSTNNLLYKTKTEKKDQRTHCADALLPISSTHKVLTALTKKIAIDLVKDLTSTKN